jgi:transcriptional regulator with PAS, ATPase and Fis domain
MQKVLLTWLGVTDIKSSQQECRGNLGPIAGAITDRNYKQAYILSDFPKQATSGYKKWLENTTSAKASIRNVTLKDPMNFGSVYDYAKQMVIEIQNSHKEENIVFAISPGTPAMAAVWIILSKTLFPHVELIESSIQDDKGNYHVRTASIPFEISAERVMDMLREPDEKLNLLFQNLPPKKHNFPEIIYKCEKMERVVTLARHAAVRNVPVLLLGESGTGKEMIAKIIYTQSLRADKIFVSVNCGAVSPNLIESELFGHVKGGFTGAVSDKDGRFMQANTGTLFLDEIGDLDFDLQVKFLRAIQENEVCPVGSNKLCKVDVRIIAATHKDLIDEVAKGKFRSDLFYRLGVAIIHIPPLRERGKDIDYLIDYYMVRINEEFARQPYYKGPKEISSAGRIALRNHHWPGNVRELENTLKRAAMWTPGSIIDKQDILDSIISIKYSADSDVLNQPLGSHLKINELLDKVAKHYLVRAWKESGGNKSRAAELIGLGSHQTFDDWIRKYHIV